MVGKEDNQEEVTFKVADRRKFNADGTLKDGVTLEPEKKAEAPSIQTTSTAGSSTGEPDMTARDEAETEDYDDIPPSVLYSDEIYDWAAKYVVFIEGPREAAQILAHRQLRLLMFRGPAAPRHGDTVPGGRLVNIGAGDEVAVQNTELRDEDPLLDVLRVAVQVGPVVPTIDD